MKMFEEFQEFRKILCMCPDCDTIVRVSELKIISKGKDVKTWLDTHENNINKIKLKEEKFDEVKDKLRAEAVSKGRKGAEKVFNNAINPKLKTLKFDPYDLKPILNPIDFLVFKNMNKGDSINDVVLLSEKIKNPLLNKIRTQVKNCISKNKYEWQVARIDKIGNIEIE